MASPWPMRHGDVEVPMPYLGDFLGHLLSELTIARAQADAEAIRIAEQKGFNLELSDLPRGHFLKSLLQTLRQDTDLGGPTTHAVGLIGADDALIVLDRAIESVVLHR